MVTIPVRGETGGPTNYQPTTPSYSAPSTQVRFKLVLNRQQVYASFNALANLAEKAGTIEVSVNAQSPRGFEPGWLRTAVLEPLEEAGVQIEREGCQIKSLGRMVLA